MNDQIMGEELLRSLVWMDYRLALLFTVIFPLVLLAWVFVRQVDPVQRLLIIYWRVASLLAITVFLLIGSLPVGFLTGFLARLLIPVGLWFWVDLNEELDDLPQNSLKLLVTSWRWAVTVYMAMGAIAQLPVLRCGFSADLLRTPFCEVWQEAPWGFREYFLANYEPGFLGFLGITGLIIYTLYLGHFVLFRLGKQGRSASQA